MAILVMFYLLTALYVPVTVTRKLAPLECFVSEDKFKEADIISHIPPAIVKMNERVTLRCKEPYIDSFTYSTCAGEDLFTPHYPPCRQVQCPIPEPEQHGSNKRNSTRTDVARQYDVLHHICVEGYWYTGTPTRSCQRNGTWSGMNGTCEEVQCSPPPPLDDGKYKEDRPYKYNSSLTAECDEGYVYNGTDTRICQQDNQWSGKEGTCIRKQSVRCCSRLEMNHHIIGYFNQVEEFACEKGYIYSGTHRRTCLVNSTWSGTDGTCNRVHCSKPQVSIENGWLVGCDVCESGFNLKVLCDIGYQHIGSTLVCTEDGNWNGTIGHCQEIQCTQQVKVANGNIKISGLSYKSIGNVTCNRNYWLFGNRVVRCQDDGSWSEPGSCRDRSDIAIGLGIALGIAVFLNLLHLLFKKIRKERRSQDMDKAPLIENTALQPLCGTNAVQQ